MGNSPDAVKVNVEVMKDGTMEVMADSYQLSIDVNVIKFNANEMNTFQSAININQFKIWSFFSKIPRL